MKFNCRWEQAGWASSTAHSIRGWAAKIALKVLPATVLWEDISIKRFQREARAASSLNHPHICTVYDVGEQDGTHYISMELMEGSTLANVLAAGPLPIEDVLKWASKSPMPSTLPIGRV